jgi:hypothetical protein
MERSQSQERSPLHVERHFVPSRVAGELMSSAYEQVVPLIRRSLPTGAPCVGLPVDAELPTPRKHIAVGGG